MAFHLGRFLVHIGAGELRRHFDQHNPELVALVDWTDAPTLVRDRARSVLEHLDGGHEQLYAAFERADRLGDELGERAVVAACNGNGAVQQDMERLGSPHERALWLLDREPVLFVRAEDIRLADLYAGAGRRWTGFVAPKERWPSLEPERLDPFRTRVRLAFRKFDGSGSTIAVDPFERPATDPGRHGVGRVFQLATYLEGLPRPSVEFDGGKIVYRGIRPALELALIYAPDTGAIDVVAHAGKPLRTAVAQAFVEELLVSDSGLKPVRLRQCALGQLSRPMPFPTDPEDGIAAVRLVRLRLAMGENGDHVTLEVGMKSARTLHEAAAGWFGQNDPLRRSPVVTQAKLVVQFQPTPGRSRARSLPVELTEPHGCNLRDRSEAERLIGEKYLRRWGLVRDV